MAFASNSTHTSNSIQEEYSYHLSEAVYHRMCAEKAGAEARDHMKKYLEHREYILTHDANFNSQVI